MMFRNIIVEKIKHMIIITFDRMQHNNSLTFQMLEEIDTALEMARASEECKVLILKGGDGIFSTGMDFNEMNGTEAQGGEAEDRSSGLYMTVLKKLSTLPLVTISCVDGRVAAGGVGFVAACDLAFATQRSTFCLTEAMWGLLPACVTPYLIRRIGFQCSYRMALTTMPVNAEKAYEIHLIDELDDNIEKLLKIQLIRLVRLEKSSILETKKYFREMWIVDEEMESRAVEKIRQLSSEKEVRDRILNYLNSGRFPWEK